MSYERTVQDQKIIIDLNETDTKGFETNNFIQVQARDKLFILIKKFVDHIPDKLDHFERVHHTILIQGKRGSGKTSFILSIKKQIENGFKNPNLDAPTPDKLEILSIIDPTLIESKEHVFINIITRIKEQVEEAIKDKNDLVYKNWKSSLVKLAGGLSMLDGVGSEHLKDNLWDSPELSLEKGLSNSKHGYKLEENFKNFVHQSLQVLNKKAFVLILDDIDTSLNEGRLILETIRKYLTTPQLITILLGDIELYSTLVRQLQWEKIDPKQTLDKYELKDNRAHYLNQIEHLEEQYLIKILMPENRINLYSLSEIKKSSNIFFLQNNQPEQFVDQFISDWVKYTFHSIDNELSIKYRNSLLCEQLRTILQVFTNWNKDEISDEYIYSLQHIFFTSLNKEFKNFDFFNLSQNKSILIYNFGLYIAGKSKLIKQYISHFEPDPLDIELNRAITYLAVLFSIKLHPHDYLSFMIKTGYVFIQFPYWDPKLKAAKIKVIESEHTLSASKFVENFKLNIGSYSNLRFGSKTFGTHFIKRDDYDLIRNHSFLSIFHIQYFDDESRSNYNFISFFKLLAFIADCETNEQTNGIEGMAEWISLFKSNKVQRMYAGKILKIWDETADVVTNIDQRNENKNKSIKDFMSLYIAGFLNRILIESEEYREFELNNYNVSTSEQIFSDNLHKINFDKSNLKNKETLTYFEYMYLCPMLDIQHPIYQEPILSKVDVTTELLTIVTNPTINKLTKPDFKKLSYENKKEIIQSIKNWERYAPYTIAKKIRKDMGYQNASHSHIEHLIYQIKNEK
ncbi:MAG: hypothetical protein JU82_07855 [Sulfuricurvum sp. MLSB]|uniref:P-loop NTPase fold protein n=1 Tax=unclassified Sulfuricurvum TaxID=2632390 RepID=UPI000504FC82|nr:MULTISPECIES: P-loop NTPase fold protein [unclassified Sulfuricurvum]KFN39254.1 MAG: hypothetical protein JU82_07855 [Sulfuricurvum sp. MLSB]